MKLGTARKLTELLYMHLEVGDEFQQNIVVAKELSLDVPIIFMNGFNNLLMIT